MITLRAVTGRRQLRAFYRVPRQVYRGDPNARSTEDDVMRMLVEHRSVFLRHASVSPFLVQDGRKVVGRFALIQDRRLPDYVQVSFFEALPGLPGLLDAILLKARALHSTCDRIVVGLNGHLNYGAGFLVGPHDLPPVFGLPYTPPYYLDYFADLRQRGMVSYRFNAQAFYDLRRRTMPTLELGEVRIRHMDRRHLAREVDLYTWLNNTCFQRHPYWSDRSTDEDYELFHPFRFLLKDENLIFAEERGRPVGFLLWYPDFNELVRGAEPLGLRHVLRYHLRNPIRGVRLTEIALHPECHNPAVVTAMMMEMIRGVQAGGYQTCEGGFIFRENRLSMAMTLHFLRKALGHRVEPSRRYCVFEGAL